MAPSNPEGEPGPPAVWVLTRRFIGSEQLKPGWSDPWEVPKASRPGDLFLVWVTGKGFGFVLRATDKPVEPKEDGTLRMNLKVLGQLMEPVTPREMEEHAVLSEWPLFRKKFRDLPHLQTQGVQEDPKVWAALQELLARRGVPVEELLAPEEENVDASPAPNAAPRRPRHGRTVLLAYSWQDDRWQRQLVKRTYAAAEGFFFTPFHDGNLLQRKEWQEEVRQQIRSSEAAVFLLSPSFLQSPTLKMVTDAVLQNGTPLLPVLVTDLAGHAPAWLAKHRAPSGPLDAADDDALTRICRRFGQDVRETVGLDRETNVEKPRSPEPPDDLVQACVSKQCVLFAGLGLNEEAGLPSADRLVKDLLDSVPKRAEVPPSLVKNLMHLAAQGQTDLVFEGLVEASERGHAATVEYLQGALRGSGPAGSRVHQSVPAVGFAGVVTSNLDDLLERALPHSAGRVYTLRDAERLIESISSKNEFFLLKLFGRLDEPDTVLLTPARYRDAVLGNVPFGQFLSTLFYSRTLLFVGKDLKGVEDFLASVPSRTGNPPRHFAFVSDSEPGWQVKASALKRRFGLELLVHPSEAGPDGAAKFLGRLAERVRKEGAGHEAPAAAQPARLAKLEVENIGPFERLEISLHPNWNVLLGDNGVGKSSILKALATAVAGEDSAPFADRLIRMGATSATVTLTTDRGEAYRAQLLRTESGVRLTSLPVRPLEKEAWLALAFPPLRTVSWERPAPYEAVQRGRAVSADVLPLVRGEADPRLDKLKAWLLYLDHNIQNQSRQKQGDDRYARLRAKFFEVVRKVTPGVNLEPGRVDPSRKQVYVKTDDGEVPIEAVSQGTQSLMGWIGIVLQRLFEVYDRDEDPTRRYVLVLMDEIDAHMHPHWQHVLVGTLKEIFPNAQFVATSHSPLVISGLSRDEVLIFRRDEQDRRIVRVDRPPTDLKGWRIDQILTSPSFGMAGARDPDTVRQLERYTELAAKESLGKDEQAELEAVAARLKLRLPTPVEREYARKAFEIIRGYAQSQLAGMADEERRKVVDEIKVQTQEGITGSRRPE